MAQCHVRLLEANQIKLALLKLVNVSFNLSKLIAGIIIRLVAYIRLRQTNLGLVWLLWQECIS